MIHTSISSRLPSSNPAVIVYTDSSNVHKHILFALERAMIDIIKASLPDGATLQALFVCPFILSTKLDLQSINSGTSCSSVLATLNDVNLQK